MKPVASGPPLPPDEKRMTGWIWSGIRRTCSSTNGTSRSSNPVWCVTNCTPTVMYTPSRFTHRGLARPTPPASGQARRPSSIAGRPTARSYYRTGPSATARSPVSCDRIDEGKPTTTTISARRRTGDRLPLRVRPHPHPCRRGGRRGQGGRRRGRRDRRRRSR